MIAFLCLCVSYFVVPVSVSRSVCYSQRVSQSVSQSTIQSDSQPFSQSVKLFVILYVIHDHIDAFLNFNCLLLTLLHTRSISF